MGLWLGMLCTISGSFDNLVWLISKCFGHLMVALLHLIARQIELSLPGFVRGDLCGIRPSLIFFR